MLTRGPNSLPRGTQITSKNIILLFKVYHFIACGTRREKYVITLSILSIKARQTKK